MDEIRLAFSDFLRRIGLRSRRDDPLEQGGGEEPSAQRQPGEATVVMRGSGAAREPAGMASPAPVREPTTSLGAEPTVISPRAPASEVPQPPSVPEAAPARDVGQAEPCPTPGQPEAIGGVDALAATRVVGEEGPGQVAGVLVAVEGELEGTIEPLVSGSNRLGRHPDCEICLPSEWISRHHARIEYQDGVFTIRAASDKPTIVNSERVDERELRDGDYIKLGKTTLRFRSIV